MTVAWKLASISRVRCGVTASHPSRVVSVFCSAPGSFFRHSGLALGPSQNGGLQSAEREIQFVALHLRQRKFHRFRISVRGQLINERPTGIAEPEQLCDLVVCFSGSIVPGLAHQAIHTRFPNFEQVGVPAADHQSQRWKSHLRVLQEHGMDVPLDVVDCDERDACSETDRLSVRHSDQQRSDQPRPCSDCDSIEGREVHPRLIERFSNNGHHRSKMLPRGELRNNPSVPGVDELRSHHVGADHRPVLNNGRCCFVARTFDS